MPPAIIKAADPALSPSATELSALPKRKRGEEAEEENSKLNKLNPIKLQALLLPSELPLNLRSACHPGLDEIEKKMQDAQCRISLDRI
jgi:hypothetical protein